MGHRQGAMHERAIVGRQQQHRKLYTRHPHVVGAPAELPPQPPEPPPRRDISDGQDKLRSGVQYHAASHDLLFVLSGGSSNFSDDQMSFVYTLVLVLVTRCCCIISSESTDPRSSHSRALYTIASHSTYTNAAGPKIRSLRFQVFQHACGRAHSRRHAMCARE